MRSIPSQLATASSGDRTEPAGGLGGSSAERSLRLLSVLARHGRPISLAELCSALALPKGTVHRLCSQLVDGGFLMRDIDERSYVVGPRLRELALDTLHHDSVRSLRHQVLADLVVQVGETCNLTTLDGHQVMYVDRVEAKWPLRMALEVGSHVPLHGTASGKLFLAHLPKARRQALISRLTLSALTPHTITDAQALQTECERIARDGHACDREEFIAGLIAVAVPVFDSRRQCRAAIAVHAPTSRMQLDDALSRLTELQVAAQRMSALL